MPRPRGPAGVKTFVALSTDKAVKPLNAMGTSKAMMEKLVCSQNQNGGDTKFCCVRYGNVMGSRGSVIPLLTADRKRRADHPYRAGDDALPMTLDQSSALCCTRCNTRPVARFLSEGAGQHYWKNRRGRLPEVQPQGHDHPIEVIGIRLGEKYTRRSSRVRDAAHKPRRNSFTPSTPSTTCRTTARTAARHRIHFQQHPQLESAADIKLLLDKMGEVEFYI
ncbi:MAG: hypothetical protein CM1200mP29_02070 [Verrucomicrobiota bacterium]|nr:MAG: hypothetical protein CM1200mP29_02070 [Verrucomicrobiota bacterium]